MQQAGWRWWRWWRLQAHQHCQADRSQEVYVTAACSRLSPALMLPISDCQTCRTLPTPDPVLEIRLDDQVSNLQERSDVRPPGEQTELLFWFHHFLIIFSKCRNDSAQSINPLFISSVSSFTEHFCSFTVKQLKNLETFHISWRSWCIQRRWSQQASCTELSEVSLVVSFHFKTSLRSSVSNYPSDPSVHTRVRCQQEVLTATSEKSRWLQLFKRLLQRVSLWRSRNVLRTLKLHLFL